MKTLVEYCKEYANFQYFKNDELWYKFEDGFMFPVPIKELNGAETRVREKGLSFMKWIREHLKLMDF